MDTSTSVPASPIMIALSRNLEIHLMPIADDRGGTVTAADLRLYRRINHPLTEGAFAATSAGLRIPLAAVPGLADALSRFASAYSAAGR